MRQSVRIIGGNYRGKKLYFPDIADLRPTPDRVKETLFNWLMHDIRQARCLDAFAGSGALGFEAYSRGAKRVVLVEAVNSVYRHLKQTAATFGTPELNAQVIHVIQAQAEDYFLTTNERFDIIFLDPPFAGNHLTTCLNQLTHTNLLVPGGLVYLESPIKVELDPQHWQEKKAKRAGQVFYTLIQKIACSPVITSA